MPTRSTFSSCRRTTTTATTTRCPWAPRRSSTTEAHCLNCVIKRNYDPTLSDCVVPTCSNSGRSHGARHAHGKVRGGVGQPTTPAVCGRRSSAPAASRTTATAAAAATVGVGRHLRRRASTRSPSASRRWATRAPRHGRLHHDPRRRHPRGGGGRGPRRLHSHAHGRRQPRRQLPTARTRPPTPAVPARRSPATARSSWARATRSPSTRLSTSRRTRSTWPPSTTSSCTPSTCRSSSSRARTTCTTPPPARTSSRSSRSPTRPAAAATRS